MDAHARTWLTADLNLLVSDVAQLRRHLVWLREDLALQPPAVPDHARDADRLVRELAAIGLALAARGMPRLPGRNLAQRGW